MKLPRRKFLYLGAGGAALPIIPRTAAALDYPTRPVRILVGLPAGLEADIVARLTGQWLSQHFGQQFVIINQPGGATTIATDMVVHAPPDGYTLLCMFLGTLTSAELYEHLDFDYIRDVAPVAGIGVVPFVLVVNPVVPAKTVPEFIAYAKANSGKLNMASAGNGTTPHLFGELFKMMTGVDLVHVPYRGSYMPDLLSGQVQLVFAPLAQSREFIASGKLRALGVTTTRGMQALPDVPPIGDFVPGYEAGGWLGIGAPKSTPTGIVATLSKSILEFLSDPKMKARLVSLGTEPEPMTTADFSKFVAAEAEKWAKVIKFANIKPE